MSENPAERPASVPPSAPVPPPESYPPPGSYPPPPATKPGNGLAIAGFVLGLLGFLGAFIPVINIGGMVLGVVGAILAGIGLAKARTTGAGKGMAIAGLMLGVLALVIGIVVNVVFVNALDEAVEESMDTTIELPSATADEAVTEEDATQEDAAADEEAAAGAVGTSRDNPAPLGSAVTGGDWTVTINSVTPVEADSLGQTPAAGSVLLLINLSATYNGDDAQGASPWATVNFVTADGTTFNGLDESTFFVPENVFDSLTSIYQGATVTGDKLLEVPADGWQSGVLAVSPDLGTDDTFVAVQ